MLHAYGVPVAEGKVAFSPDEAASHAPHLGENLWVVKAQIHAGGRGKGGGVSWARASKSCAGNRSACSAKLVTHQTGPKGRIVPPGACEAGLHHQARVLFGASRRPRCRRIAFVLIRGGHGYRAGRCDHSGDHRPRIDPGMGITPFHTRMINAAFGIYRRSGTAMRQAARRTLQGLCRDDARLIEINPLS